MPVTLLSGAISTDAKIALFALFHLKSTAHVEVQGEDSSYPSGVSLSVQQYHKAKEREAALLDALNEYLPLNRRVLILTMSKASSESLAAAIRLKFPTAQLRCVSGDSSLAHLQAAVDSSASIISTTVLAQSANIRDLRAVFALGAYSTSDVFQAISRVGRCGNKATAVFMRCVEEEESIFGVGVRYTTSVQEALIPFLNKGLPTPTLPLRLAYTPIGLTKLALSTSCRRQFFSQLFGAGGAGIACSDSDGVEACDNCRRREAAEPDSVSEEQEDQLCSLEDMDAAGEKDLLPPGPLDPSSVLRDSLMRKLRAVFELDMCFLCGSETCNGFIDQTTGSRCRARRQYGLISAGDLCFRCGDAHNSAACMFPRKQNGYLDTASLPAHCKICLVRYHLIHPSSKDELQLTLDACKKRGNRIFAALTAIYHSREDSPLRRQFADTYGKWLVSVMPTRAGGTSEFWQWLKLHASSVGGSMRHIDLATAFLSDLRTQGRT